VNSLPAGSKNALSSSRVQILPDKRPLPPAIIQPPRTGFEEIAPASSPVFIDEAACHQTFRADDAPSGQYGIVEGIPASRRLRSAWPSGNLNSANDVVAHDNAA